MQKIPIGTANFKRLRDDNKYYSDKTNNIKEFLNINGDVTILARPRRFGKTLFQSTIYYFFSNLERNEEIFKDTAIYNDKEFFSNHFGKYPVIFLTLKDLREPTFDRFIESLSALLFQDIEKYSKAINEVEGCMYEKRILNKILDSTFGIVDLEKSIKALSIILTNYYNQSPIILIDEYDTPIITSWLKDYYSEAIEFFRGFFGNAFKDNDLNVKKVLLTGIFRVSGESMFSGLNNLKYITILDNDLSSSCGFIIDESIKLLKDYNFEQKTIDKAIHWYNGYTIGEDIILNPWSMLNFTSTRKFDTYWIHTSSNDFIYDLLNKSQSLKDEFEKLLNNEPIDIKVEKNLTFQGNKIYSKEGVFSFLFFGGYLKCQEKYTKLNDDDTEDLRCKLIPTNIECKKIFRDVIYEYANSYLFSDGLQNMINSLLEANIELFEEFLEEALLNIPSYYDTKTENSYHMFLLGMLVYLQNDYEIISNSEAGYGRVDIIILNKHDKNKPAIIMELKKINIRRNETKDEALDKAIDQIIQKDYISLAKKKGYSNIIAFGLVFDGKRCWSKEI